MGNILISSNSFKTVFLNNYNDLYAVIIEPFNASSMTEMSKDQLVQIRNLTKNTVTLVQIKEIC